MSHLQVLALRYNRVTKQLLPDILSEFSRLEILEMLQLSEAAIISTTIEALLFGFSIFMFLLTLWILLRNRCRRRLNYAMIISACSLQVFATTEQIVNIVRLCQGFLNVGPKLPHGPEQYFADVTQSTFIIKSCLYNVQTLILDGVVIYRTYVVWQRAYVVIIPLLGWCALLASSIGTNVALATAAEHADDIFAKQTGRWITSIYSTTLATNLSATGLLAFRIWQVNRQAAKYRSNSRFSPILRVVIESGAIYSVTITAALITFVIGSPGVYVLLDMISPIISIVFNMIIIRVGLASDRKLPGTATTMQQNTAVERIVPQHNNGRRGPYQPNDGYEMKSLTVEITQYFESDDDAPSTIGPDGADFSRPRDEENSISGKPSSSLAL